MSDDDDGVQREDMKTAAVETVVRLPVSCLSFSSLTEKTAALHLHILTIVPLFLLSCLGGTGAQGQAVYPTRFLHPRQETVCKVKNKDLIHSVFFLSFSFWKYIEIIY